MLKKLFFICAAFAMMAFIARADVKAGAALQAGKAASGEQTNGLVKQVDYNAASVADSLEDRGYYAISIDDDNPPYYRYMACKRGKLYRLKVDQDGDIRKRRYKGRCGDGDGEGTRVSAPFTDVYVGKRGVHVRAPFVNIRIPKRH